MKRPDLHTSVIMPIIVISCLAFVGVRVVTSSHAAVAPTPSTGTAAYKANSSLITKTIFSSEEVAHVGTPSESLAPSPNFNINSICTFNVYDNSSTCNSAVVSAINNGRRVLEGLPALSLNLAAYEKMTVPEQLFVITNLERLNRGLTPIAALTNQLNVVAQGGANNNTDPSLSATPLTGGVPVEAEGSNWAGRTNNPLGTDYYLMYDDGYASPNGACSTATPAACWGHRNNILGTYTACSGGHTYMGAAYSAANDDFTEIFAGGCGTPTDEVFTWQQALGDLNGVHKWTGPSILYVNQTLTSNQSLASSSGNYRLTYQSDGNLVVYNSVDVATWNSGTGGKGVGRLVMQSDGNLVIYNASNQWLWQTVTGGTGSNNRLVMQTDGNLVLYTSSNVALWSSGTGLISNHTSTLGVNKTLTPGQYLESTNAAYQLIYQSDGNLVLYNAFGEALWQSATSGKGVGYVVMQSDGNLVIYNGSAQAVWQSGTGGSGSSNDLAIQTDGNAVIYTSAGKAVWQSGT